MATQTRYASKDAHMGKRYSGSAFSGWNGKDAHLLVGADTADEFKHRAVIYFAPDFTDMDEITEARLFLYDKTTGTNIHNEQTSAPTAMNINRMTSDWGEGSVDPGEGNLTSTLAWDWDNRYDKYSFAGEVTYNVTQGANSNEQEFDVTDIVTAWFNGSANYGFILRLNLSAEETSNKGLQFFSREEDASGDNRPKLVITYTSNTAPNAPTLTSPVDGEVKNTLTPTLSGTRSDPDTGDYITGVQIQVYNPGEPFTFSTTTTASDPGSGNIRLNNASAPTAIYVSQTDSDGNSFAASLAALVNNDTVVLQSTGDDGELLDCLVNGTPTDNGAWWTIPIDGVDLTGTFDNSDGAMLFIEPDADTHWDSGAITIAGSPTTFSVTYGSVGSADTLLGNHYYRWRAKTKDSGGLWGPYAAYSLFKTNSTPNTPTVTINSTPTTDIRDDTPQLSITHNDNDPDDSQMYAYQVVIEKETSPGSGSWGSSGGWDSGQVDTSGAPITTQPVTSGTLAWGGSYRVKARTKDQNNAWSSYSSWQDMDLHSTGVPINLDPSSSETVSATPTFTGARATSVDTITSYEIELYTDALSSLWSSGVLTTGIASGATFSKLYPGSPALSSGFTYKWKARVTSSVGGVSAWSSLQTFIVVDATTPTISSPTGTGISDLTPDIVMTRASVYNRLQVELYPSTSTSDNLGTVITASGTKADADADTIITGAGPTTGTWTYSGTALTYDTTYKIRARVSSDGGSNWSSWSGLTSFTTDAAEAPSLTSVGGETQTGIPVIIDATPDMVITRGGSDTIDYAQVRVWNANYSTMIWDSTLTNVTNATTATITYAGSALVPGTTYTWEARYQKTTGPVGPYSSPEQFRLNAPPSVPTSLSPPTGHVFSDDDLIIFEAAFVDADTAGFGDTPTSWRIEIEEIDTTPHDIEDIVTGLIVGVNSVEWPGTALLVDTDYQWRTRFTDSQGQAGAFSGWRTFRIAVPPNGTITAPSSGWPTVNNENTVRPTIAWSFVGGTQLSYVLDIDEADADGVKLRDVTTLSYVGAETSRQIPAGYMKKDKYYNVRLTVRNTDLLYDPTPSDVLILINLDAPDPITGLSPTTYETLSLLKLEWDQPTLLANHTFVSYYIYRRVAGDEQWQLADTVDTLSINEYNDWYAGHSVHYEYRVSIVTTKTGVGIELESSDDPDGGSLASVVFDSDVWMIVGADRAEEHILEIPVVTENHNRPVQQESFETLGSSRKIIVRGFVLGHEGTINVMWANQQVQSPLDEQIYYNETVIARRLLDYITNNKGPHILKSPFGDVWDVEFSGPEYEWQNVGHLSVDLSWVETGDTSQVSI